MKTRVVDYDSIAGSYDRRYEENDYSGVELALLDFLGCERSLRVMEVGCGTGYWLTKLATRSSAFGLDPSGKMIGRARLAIPGVPLVRGRAEHLPWRNATFDRVYCINAFHHLSDKDAFAAEAYRVIRPTGGLMTVGLDPHTKRDRWWIYEYFYQTFEIDLRRYPACEEIRAIMAKAGFVQCETREVQHLPGKVSARAALERGLVDKSVTSQLAVLSDEEYQQGLDRLRQGIEEAHDRGEELMLVADLHLYATIGWVV